MIFKTISVLVCPRSTPALSSAIQPPAAAWQRHCYATQAVAFGVPGESTGATRDVVGATTDVIATRDAVPSRDVAPTMSPTISPTRNITSPSPTRNVHLHLRRETSHLHLRQETSHLGRETSRLRRETPSSPTRHAVSNERHHHGLRDVVIV